MLKQNLALFGISSLFILQFIVVPQVYAIEEFEDIDVGSSPIQIALNPNTNTIYVTNQANTILVIDAFDNKIIDIINIGTFPRGIAVNAVTNTIYVTNPLDDTVSVIDGSNNVVVDSIIVDDGSFGIAVNEATNTVYTVSCFYEINAVSVIDGSKNTLKDPFLIEECAWTVAVNPQTNSVFVANPTLNSIFVFDDIVTESKIEISSEPVIISDPIVSEIISEPILTKKIETSKIPTSTQIIGEPAQNSLDMFAFLGVIVVGMIVGVITIKNRNKEKSRLIKNNEFEDGPEKNAQKKKNIISQKLQNRVPNPQTEIVMGIDTSPMIENKIQLILKLEKYHIGDKIKLDEIKNSLLSDGSFTKKDNDYIETQYEQYKKIALISD